MREKNIEIEYGNIVPLLLLFFNGVYEFVMSNAIDPRRKPSVDIKTPDIDVSLNEDLLDKIFGFIPRKRNRLAYRLILGSYRSIMIRNESLSPPWTSGNLLVRFFMHKNVYW